jgi:ligand-binding sensor domain-containing protein
LFFSTVLYGQQLIFNNIKLNNNLPSKECYSVFQDTRGYIWISTELGLCKLSTSNLKIYNKKNGLPENAIYAYINYGGKYWLVTSKNRVLNLVGDQLSESSWSNLYQKTAKRFSGHTYQLYASKNLIFSNNGATIVLDTSAHTLKTPLIKAKTIRIDCINGLSLQYDKLPNVIIGKLKLEILQKKGLLTIDTRVNSVSSHRFLAVKNDSCLFIALGRVLIKVNQNNNYQIVNLPSDIINLYMDKDNELWVGLYKNGVYYYRKGNVNNPIINLSSLSVSGILQDNERNIWCTTLEKGAFMAKSKEIINYSNVLGNYYGQAVIKTINDHTLFLRNSKLYAITNDTIQQVQKGNITNEFISTYLKQPLFFSTTQVYDYAQVGKGFYTISYGNICKINPTQLESISLKSPGRCIAKLNATTLLYGCDNGIYRFNIQTKQSQKVCSTPDRPTKIFINSRKECLIATKGSGTFILRRNNLYALKLPAEIIYDIAEDKIGNLWFASNKGLLKRKINGQSFIFTTANGLPSNEVYKLSTNQGKLYCLTSEGLVSISTLAEISNVKAPFIYLRSVQIGKNGITFHQGIKLSHHQNSLQFNFDVLSFKNDSTKIKYSILPLNGGFRYTFNEQIDLENLSPDSYRLQVQGVNSDGFAGKPIKLTFQVEKPYWKTWWFVSTVWISVLTLAFTTTRYLFIRTRRKELEKAHINQLIAESKLTALQAQMNPHFIFNCINSIQNYILKKQEKDAYNYLSRFSQLIRMVLTHSQRKSITLNDELTMLELYISLEQLRFSNTFEYIKSVDDSIPLQNILIPPMLVQPYVENAIWHGLMHLGNEKRGRLQIDVKTQNNLLIICVKDNGIGRKLANEYRENNLHQPFGINSNHQRINVLNQTYGNEKQFSVTITDLPNNSGTEVTIYIPINI